MWEVPLGTQQSENVVNKILAQTSKPELAQYLYTSLFWPTTKILLKAIKQGFLETFPGLPEKLIKKHLEKSRNTKIGNLHMRRQGIQLTKEKPPDTDLEDNIKTNLLFCTTEDPSTNKEGKIYSDICRRFPTTSTRGDKCTYVMYLYNCNSILTKAMNNKSDKDMIRAFTSLTEYLKAMESTKVSISWTINHPLI